MIITDKFVYVHMPKTGGTFATTVLRRIHEARGDQIIERRADARVPILEQVRNFVAPKPTFLMLLNEQGDTKEWNQHGACSQIPPQHLNKPILTTIRNPFDRYVSQYEFKWWQMREPAESKDPEGLLRKYPHYPDVSFEEFILMMNEFFFDHPMSALPPEDSLGLHTMQFVRYFYKDNEKFSEIDNEYLAQKRYYEDIFPNLHFTFTHSLNQELHDFLLKMGYKQEEIAFILEEGKIFPKRGGRSEDQKWEKYYTPEIKAWVRHHERMLFEMFPQFDE